MNADAIAHLLPDLFSRLIEEQEKLKTLYSVAKLPESFKVMKSLMRSIRAIFVYSSGFRRFSHRSFVAGQVGVSCGSPVVSHRRGASKLWESIRHSSVDLLSCHEIALQRGRSFVSKRTIDSAWPVSDMTPTLSALIPAF
jgi:hypothetical protein